MRIRIPNRKRLILMGVLLILTVAVTALVRVDCGFVRQVGRNQVPAGTYATFGDVCVFLNAILLGNPWAAIVSALGCAIADACVGSYSYIIGTLLIKAAMALFLVRYAKHCDSWKKSLVVAMLAEAIMLIGYFLFDLLIFVEYEIAVKEILVNLAQGLLCGTVGAALIRYFLPEVRRVRAEKRKKAQK